MSTWKAVYSNREVLNQYNEDGSCNQYPDIDRDRLEYFDIVEGDKLIFRLHLEAGRRLIYRKRVAQDMMSGAKTFVFLVGWQATVNGKNVQDIAYVFEDGHVELAGKWKSDSRWLYAPNLIECERDGKSK